MTQTVAQQSGATSSADAGLAVEGLAVAYGSAKALFEVDLVVPGGSVVALLGANGAGKSTLGRAIAGLVPVAEGEVWFDGNRVTGRAAHQIRRAGLAYIPEGRGIFPGLTVSENLRMAVRILPKGQREAAIEEAFSRFVVLRDRRNQRAGSLSGGEQQMLALARTLATGPRLVIADEMSLGLAPKIVDAVFEGLESARRSGVTIVLIEQFIHRALSFADTCVVLSRGQVSWSGPSSEAQDEVLQHYIGGQ